MKKENFVSMVIGAAGGFAIGMCMCLLTEWNTFRQGIVAGVVGLVILLVMLVVRRKMQGKPPIRLSAKAVGTVFLGIVGALVLGAGMCMTMVWEGLLVQGILVGVAGIVLLLCLVPVCKGLE